MALPKTANCSQFERRKHATGDSGAKPARWSMDTQGPLQAGTTVVLHACQCHLQMCAGTERERGGALHDDGHASRQKDDLLHLDARADAIYSMQPAQLTQHPGQFNPVGSAHELDGEALPRCQTLAPAAHTKSGFQALRFFAPIRYKTASRHVHMQLAQECKPSIK